MSDELMCFHCGGQLVWDNDYSYEDMGWEGDGFTHNLHCVDCGAEVMYMIDSDENDK